MKDFTTFLHMQNASIHLRQANVSHLVQFQCQHNIHVHIVCFHPFERGKGQPFGLALVSSALFCQCVFASVLKELCLIYFCASCLLSSGITVEVQVLYLQETDICHGRFHFSFQCTVLLFRNISCRFLYKYSCVASTTIPRQAQVKPLAHVPCIISRECLYFATMDYMSSTVCWVVHSLARHGFPYSGAEPQFQSKAF